MHYLFDPNQFKELGYNFYQGEDFYYRYQERKRLFFRSIYIPLGPNCPTPQGFDNFLNHINNFRFSKIKIDLPNIYDKAIKLSIINKLKKAGFKKSKYIQDEETIIVKNEDLSLPHKEMYWVRYSLKRADLVVKDKLNDKEIDQIYDIYKVAISRLGAEVKDKSIFKKLSESCLAVIAYDKKTNQPEGYILGYLTKANLKDITKSDNQNLLLVMYTGLTDQGRKLKLGRAMHYQLFKSAFEDHGVSICDFHGASRSHDRSYLEFKLSFSKRFLSLPGSFTRTRFF